MDGAFKWVMICFAVMMVAVCVGAAVGEYSDNQLEIAKLQYQCEGGVE